ncbi:MAG TPA: hypothetical protein VFA65_09430 [Bryobacteraceae bacterium]|nr:hypothetical protein [Bryobacteraceae bacterium]
MSAPAVPISSAQATPTAQLSQANAIEYKAYVRKFFDTGDGTLFVIASCYYDNGGMTIFFNETNPGQLSLMEQPPTGAFTNIVSAYVASWTSKFNADKNPPHLTITDGHGQHRVPVRSWNQ